MKAIILTERHGYPKTIKIETKKTTTGFMTLVTDDSDEDIAKFNHVELRSRLLWADGYFKALREKNPIKKVSLY